MLHAFTAEKKMDREKYTRKAHKHCQIEIETERETDRERQREGGLTSHPVFAVA